MQRKDSSFVDLHFAFSVLRFVSPFGPSVYRCKCGFVFGDPFKTLTPSYTLVLKDRRNTHFRKAFGADYNGYPTATSAHYPLHRAIQRVMTSAKFVSAQTLSEDIVQAVAKYLKKKSKGNFYLPGLRGTIERVAQSYLDCRHAKMKEPEHNEPIDFLKKALIEQGLIKANNGWVDAWGTK